MNRWLLKVATGLAAVASVFVPALAVQATAQAQPADIVRFYHVDPLGSTRAITDVNGEVVSRKDYLPFGDELTCDFGRSGADEYCGPAFDPNLRFAGKERDDESGLDYFGARYHSAAQGRFTSVDPEFVYGDHINDPQQWNRYTYAVNNPYTYGDPDGRVIKALVLLGKVGHAAYKGYDIYSTVQGVTESASKIVSLDVKVGTGDRLWATASLVSELSGATDLFKAGKKAVDAAATVVSKIDDARDAAKTGQKVANGGDGTTRIVYTINDPKTDDVLYVGRASGKGDAQQVLEKRKSAHEHKDKGEFRVADVNGSYEANRGAEDVIYRREQLKAQAKDRTLLNKHNPIGARNKKGKKYVGAYNDEWVQSEGSN